MKLLLLSNFVPVHSVAALSLPVTPTSHPSISIAGPLAHARVLVVRRGIRFGRGARNIAIAITNYCFPRSRHQDRRQLIAGGILTRSRSGPCDYPAIPIIETFARDTTGYHLAPSPTVLNPRRKLSAYTVLIF